MNSSTAEHIRLLYILTGLLAIVALILLFAGCSTKVATDTTASQAAAPVEETQTPPAVNEFAKKFGDTITWSDGVSISVGAPTTYTPTEYAAGVVDGSTNVVFEIVLTNNGAEPYDPVVWPSVSSGGVEASNIADVGSDLGTVGLVPTTTVLPGQTIKWYQAFSVADANAITFQISPDPFGDKGVFTNIPF